MASKQVHLKYQALDQPISVTAADSKSTLKTVATMEVPIKWETGNETVFTMLVVPGFVWRILFGENHLHATRALVDHHVPSVTFRYPSMQFLVQCSLENPLTGFESILGAPRSLQSEGKAATAKSHASITCLLTVTMPPGLPKHSQPLHRGLKFVTVCLSVSAGLMGHNTMHQPLWIEGRDLQPGVKVLSGPFDLSQISSHVTPPTNCPSNAAKFCNAHLVKLFNTDNSEFMDEVTDPLVTCCTTLAVESKLKKGTIPQNVVLGDKRDMTLDDGTVLENAADTTAKQLADGCLTWAETQQQSTLPQSVTNKHLKKDDLDSCSPKLWKLTVQQQEMETSRLDSSIFTPYCTDLPECDSHTPEFPPLEELNCDPYLPSY